MPINLHDTIQELKADGIILSAESNKYHPTTVVTLKHIETGIICSSGFDTREVSDDLKDEIYKVRKNLDDAVSKFKKLSNE